MEGNDPLAKCYKLAGMRAAKHFDPISLEIGNLVILNVIALEISLIIENARTAESLQNPSFFGSKGKQRGSLAVRKGNKKPQNESVSSLWNTNI